MLGRVHKHSIPCYPLLWTRACKGWWLRITISNQRTGRASSVPCDDGPPACVLLVANEVAFTVQTLNCRRSVQENNTITDYKSPNHLQIIVHNSSNYASNMVFNYLQ